MRTLAIKREKSFIGLSKDFEIYMVDKQNPTETIRNLPCRRVGTLRNGHIAKLSIPTGRVHLFITAGKVAKEFGCEELVIPAGEENLHLTGKCLFNPGIGNAFRFHSLPWECKETIRTRKKGQRIGWALCIAAVLVGALAGYLVTHHIFSGSNSKEKVFSVQGMQITLTEAFSETEPDEELIARGATARFESKEALVLVSEEAFTDVGDAAFETTEGYAKRLAQANGSDTVLQTEHGVPFFMTTFTDMQDGTVYRSLIAIYESSSAFIRIQFLTDAETFENKVSQFRIWADSVCFEKSGNAA